MKLDKRDVIEYNVVVTSDEYPDIFESPRYKRMGMVMDLITQRGIVVDQIVKETVSGSYVTLQFLSEK